jgi:hypothetical protein
MAYNEFLADRIRQNLLQKKVNFRELEMMGGLCFMVNEKMCCGVLFDKNRNIDLLMARIGEEAYKEALKKEFCLPMDFSGRPMKGYVFITDEGLDLDTDLNFWIKLCLNFNPFAKSSPKRKNK